MSTRFAEDLRRMAIRPPLEKIELWSEDAEELVLATWCAESGLQALDQIDSGEWTPGPGYGLGQMERATHDDIWANYLRFRPSLALVVGELTSSGRVDVRTIYDPTTWPRVDELAWNLRYMAAMTRLRYRRVRSPLPPRTDVAAMASYWKEHYNTARGKGTERHFEREYTRLVAR